MEGLHLYCVIRGERETAPGPIGLPVSAPGGQAGLDGRRVAAVHHCGLAALVSAAPIRPYGAMKKPEIIPYLFAHQAVIEQFMKDRTAIPVKFGTMARDEREVRWILERGRGRLVAALEAMEGKVELDLVARWRDLNAVLRAIGEEDEDIRRAGAAIAARPLAEAREGRIRIGQMLKARLDQRREGVGAEIVEALSAFARALSYHPAPDDRLILNVAFLLPREGEEQFGERLADLDARYDGAIEFRCVGPLPPHSFCTVDVRRVALGEIEQARRLLGLGNGAGPAELRAAYRRLAQRRHPDKRPGGQLVGREFEELTAAYRLLLEYCEGGGAPTGGGYPAGEADGDGALSVRILAREAKEARVA